MLLGRRLDQAGHTIAVHPGKVGGSCAAHCPGTVHHRVCVPHQTTQVFLVIKVPFYPMDTDTCKMVPIGRGANQRTYLPMLGSQSMRQGAAYEPCCPCERYDTRHLAIPSDKRSADSKQWPKGKKPTYQGCAVRKPK